MRRISNKSQLLTFLGLALSLAVTLSYQACSPMNFETGGSNDNFKSAAGGGNGGTFDGKPDPGTYYRLIPDLRCGADLALFGKIIVDAVSMRAELLDPRDCSIVNQEIPIAQLDYASYNPAFIGFADGVFEKKASPPPVEGNKDPLPDALCRGVTTQSRQPLDVLVQLDASTSAASSVVILSNKKLPVGAVSRSLSGRKVSYNANGFELSIDMTQAADPQSYKFTAKLKGSIDGQDLDETLACRTAGLLDQQLPPPQSAPTPNPSSGTLLFADSFESGDYSLWSYVQALSATEGPGAKYNYIAPASTMGIPGKDGLYAARFEVPASATSTTPHAKVHKEWSNVGKKDQYGRTEETLPNGGNPSGIYSAWFFLPYDYQAASSDWTQIFGLKEEGYISGVWHQDPSWWINISPASAWGSGGSEPVLFVNHWNADTTPGFNPKRMAVPRGRWFEIRAHLYEHDRIEWYIDGQLFDTSLQATYPVGRFYDQSDGWIWSLGHTYGIGSLAIDNARVTTLP